LTEINLKSRFNDTVDWKNSLSNQVYDCHSIVDPPQDPPTVNGGAATQNP